VLLLLLLLLVVLVLEQVNCCCCCHRPQDCLHETAAEAAGVGRQAARQELLGRVLHRLLLQ
jgi:hypothetical protein